MLTRVLGALDAVSRWMAYVAAALVVAIAVLILAEIFCRTVLNISLTFAWDYSAYFMAAAILFAAAFTLRTGGHVRVSLLTASVPRPVARTVDFVATLFGAGIGLFLAYALVLFAWESFLTGRTSATIDATPLVYPHAALAFGAVLLALQLVARLVRLLTGEQPEDLAAKARYGVDEH